MTGQSYKARGEEVPLRDSEYSDDTAVIFCNHHFHRFGTEIHTGVIEARQSSKTEL